MDTLCYQRFALQALCRSFYTLYHRPAFLLVTPTLPLPFPAGQACFLYCVTETLTFFPPVPLVSVRAALYNLMTGSSKLNGLSSTGSRFNHHRRSRASRRKGQRRARGRALLSLPRVYLNGQPHQRNYRLKAKARRKKTSMRAAKTSATGHQSGMPKRCWMTVEIPWRRLQESNEAVSLRRSPSSPPMTIENLRAGRNGSLHSRQRRVKRDSQCMYSIV